LDFSELSYLLHFIRRIKGFRTSESSSALLLGVRRSYGVHKWCFSSCFKLVHISHQLRSKWRIVPPLSALCCCCQINSCYQLKQLFVTEGEMR